MAPRRNRDYAAEYQRRKERGAARGLSVRQARGHGAGMEAGMSEHEIRTLRREQREISEHLDNLQHTHAIYDVGEAYRLGIAHFGSPERFLAVLRQQDSAQQSYRHTGDSQQGHVRRTWNRNRKIGRTLAYDDIRWEGHAPPYSVFAYYH